MHHKGSTKPKWDKSNAQYMKYENTIANYTHLVFWPIYSIDRGNY
jgi:hypothetical protein